MILIGRHYFPAGQTGRAGGRRAAQGVTVPPRPSRFAPQRNAGGTRAPDRATSQPGEFEAVHAGYDGSRADRRGHIRVQRGYQPFRGLKCHSLATTQQLARGVSRGPKRP